MVDYVAQKIVIITGGSSGFGLETARLLLARGAKVAITGRDAGRLKQAEKELKNANLLAIRADATKTEDWRMLCKKVVEAFGRIDVLVNNHGAGVKIADTEGMDDESIDRVLDVNLASVIRGCREVIPFMKKNGFGQIINVSSGCAYHSWRSWGVYTAAKAGLVGFTRCLHLEMAQWGGKATSFIPGAAKTNFCKAAGLDGSWQEGYPSAEDFARSIIHCIDVPPGTFVEEINVWGTKQTVDMMNPF